MSPVTGFIIFCRLEDGNLTDSRLCRRFPILIPFTRRFENRQLLYCLSALVFQTYSLDKSFMSLCPLSKYMRMHFSICDPSGRASSDTLFGGGTAFTTRLPELHLSDVYHIYFL